MGLAEALGANELGGVTAEACAALAGVEEEGDGVSDGAFDGAGG
jgi:hypothetical protein